MRSTWSSVRLAILVYGLGALFLWPGCGDREPLVIGDGGPGEQPVVADGMHDGGTHDLRPGEDPPLPEGGTDGPKICGPFAGGACKSGYTCDILKCATGATGKCVPLPSGCPKNYAPVCGCNGQTYGNNCFRLMAGVALKHQGACATDGGPPDKPVWPDGPVWPDFGPWPDGPPPQKCGPWIGGQCPSTHVCNVQSCGIGASGICVPKPTSCPKLWAPVCGCDGQTYGNDCLRVLAGVGLAHYGSCYPDAGPPPDVWPPWPDGPAPMKCGPWSGGQCPKPFVCDVHSCAIGAGGVCVPYPVTCPYLWDPVCGCNNQTYANDCMRVAANVALQHYGQCGVIVDAGKPKLDL